MGGQWGSTLVALGLIALFYFTRKYYRKKPPLNSQSFQPSTRKTFGKPIQSSGKSVAKKSASSSPSSHSGFVVMHPHSLEVAKKEFVQFALQFRGSYESLFLSCQGKVTGVNREHVIKNWEESIQETEAKYLILTWTTIVQKHCGRNFYRKGTPSWGRDAKVERQILEEWLKQLFKWGLQREMCGQRPTIEFEGVGSEKPRWTLNGEVVEEGEERAKLQGH